MQLWEGKQSVRQSEGAVHLRKDILCSAVFRLFGPTLAAHAQCVHFGLNLLVLEVNGHYYTYALDFFADGRPQFLKERLDLCPACGQPWRTIRADNHRDGVTA